MKKAIGTLGLLVLAGCSHGPDRQDGVASAHLSPEVSGLVGVRPYPNADDVCQVIGENALTSRHLDHTSILIGCPRYEAGAIADRVAEGAVVLEDIGEWTLLSARL